MKKALVIISSTIFTCTLFMSYNYDNILRHFIYFIFGGILFYIFYNQLFDEKGNYKGIRILKKHFIIILSIITIIINSVIILYYETKLNAETLFEARNYGVYADFKKNGTYIIKSGSWASKKHFYGKYKINDTILTIDQEKLNDILTSNQFAIRERKDSLNNLCKYLIQIDKNGKEIKNNEVYDFNPTRKLYTSYEFDILK